MGLQRAHRMLTGGRFGCSAWCECGGLVSDRGEGAGPAGGGAASVTASDSGASVLDECTLDGAGLGGEQLGGGGEGFLCMARPLRGVGLLSGGVVWAVHRWRRARQ